MLQQHYNGKISKALVQLFPEIGLDEALFVGCPPSITLSFSLLPFSSLPFLFFFFLILIPNLESKSFVAKSKKIFEVVANKSGLNPLIASDWRSLSSRIIANSQVHTHLYIVTLCIILQIHIND